MKKSLFTILLVFVSGLIFSQTYYYKNRKESIKYTDSFGKIKYKVISNTTDNYKLVFNLSADGKNTPLYTIYLNGDEMYWAIELESKGYREFEDKIYKEGIYLNTSLTKKFHLLVSQDKTRILTVYDEDLIEYY